MKNPYSLALWWWAARWLAHIWVIKYLAKNGIRIKEVSWTSMWAIIWALFAMGKTWEEIRDFAKSINYLKLIDVDMNHWVLKWKKVFKKLEEVFWDKCIEDLQIILKIVATNIETWEKEVFKKWRIVDAVRASISLPWVFVPYKIWDNSYVDGGISNNLPIEVLEWNNVIAVSALKQVNTPLKKKRTILWFDLPVWFLNINFQILQRTILLMMKQNEDRSLEIKNKNIIYINPNKNNLDFYNFDKVDEFIKNWYEKAKEIIK